MCQHPRVSKVKEELKRTRVKGPRREDGPIDDKTLIRLLPQRELADKLVQSYIDTFETTYRVLHLPSFWLEYSGLWDSPGSARPAFVAVVILMLAATKCMHEQDPHLFVGDSSLGRETACAWIETCESWLSLQSQKRIMLAYLQAQCILLIAKQMNSYKRKRRWTLGGNLMSFAVAAGLHRDAEIINLNDTYLPERRVSFFNQEMRRRLWSTISELELQSALDRGMPASLPDLRIDCGPPSNCDDEDLSLSMEQGPVSHPISQYTRSSFQYLLSTTWDLRRQLVSLINGSQSALTYEDTLHYDRLVMKNLDNIPHWDAQGSQLSRSLLVIQFEQLLNLLHRPFVVRDRPSSRFNYSANVHLDTAKAIVDIHKDNWCAVGPVLSVFRQDILGAGLAICYNFVATTNLHREQTYPTYDTHLYLRAFVQTRTIKVRQCLGLRSVFITSKRH